MSKRHWTRYLPYLELYLNIPLLTIHTNILVSRIERLTFDIIRIRIKFWKWEGEFDLYKKEKWS